MTQRLLKTAIFIFLLTLCFYWLDVTEVQGEPYFAVREGFKCSQCHVNRTGGGKRNGFGTIYSQTSLPMWTPDNARFKNLDTDSGIFLDPNLNNFISFGGDLRVMNTFFFPEQSGPDGLQSENGFGITEGNIYIEARLLGDYVSIYYDETFAPSGAMSREAFGIIQNLPWNSYMKAGKFLLPYGLRLQDDASFIRQVMGYTYSTPDIGVEFGLEPGPFSFSVAFTNGTQGGAENNFEKQVSLAGSIVFRHFRIGGSYANNEGPTSTRFAYGPFAGVSFGRFTLLGEADWINDLDKLAVEVTDQFVAYGELDFLVWKGLNLKVSYDYHDPDVDIDENERERIGVGIEPFITQFLQFRIMYHNYNSIPQLADENFQEIMAEIHFFF